MPPPPARCTRSTSPPGMRPPSDRSATPPCPSSPSPPCPAAVLRRPCIHGPGSGVEETVCDPPRRSTMLARPSTCAGLDTTRRPRPSHRTKSCSARSAPVDRIATRECSARVRRAVAELPANERRVLEMVYYQGLTQAEIAATLDAPLGTVKSWCRRGLLGLRAALADLVE